MNGCSTTALPTGPSDQVRKHVTVHRPCGEPKVALTRSFPAARSRPVQHACATFAERLLVPRRSAGGRPRAARRAAPDREHAHRLTRARGRAAEMGDSTTFSSSSSSSAHRRLVLEHVERRASDPPSRARRRARARRRSAPRAVFTSTAVGRIARSARRVDQVLRLRRQRAVQADDVGVGRSSSSGSPRPAKTHRRAERLGEPCGLAADPARRRRRRSRLPVRLFAEHELEREVPRLARARSSGRLRRRAGAARASARSRARRSSRVSTSGVFATTTPRRAPRRGRRCRHRRRSSPRSGAAGPRRSR